QRARDILAAHGNCGQILPGNDSFKRVVYLGSGSFQGLARESAIIMCWSRHNGRERTLRRGWSGL
ncbi:hypothetical protein KDV24_06910, partial [Morganella morganii]